MKTLARYAALLILFSNAGAQAPPWVVTVKQSLDPLPIGMCGAVHLTLLDPVTRDVPRNPRGYRITMADFDMSVSGGTSAAGQQVDAYHFVACGCQGGTPGTTATVIARYPAQSLPSASRVPGVSIQQSATFTLALPKGSTNPASCVAMAASGNVGGAAATGGGAAGAAASGGAASAGGAAQSGSGAAASGNVGGAAAAGGGAAGAAASGGAASAGNAAQSGSGAAASGNVGGAAAAGGGVAGAAATGGGAAGAAASGGAAAAAQGGVAGATGNVGSGAAGSAGTGAAAAAQAGAQPGASIPTSARGASAVGTPMAPATGTTATTVVPVNPSKLDVGQLGSGEVGLSWPPVTDASFYVVFGPGLTPGGQRVENQTDPRYASTPFPPQVTLMANNVPVGMQEWRVASFYSPGNISTPASQFTRASLNVTAPEPAPGATPTTPTPPAAAPAPSGRYLVTITGLRAYQASVDDMLSRDGVGDEVYVAAYVRNYDQRSGQLASVTTRISAVHGDVNKFGAQRLQAGTRSGTGGIHDGDMIPDGGFIATRSVPAQDVTFPMRIFEGALTDGVDALLISPSIWEQDVTNSFFQQWQQNQATLNLSLFAKPGVHAEITDKTFKPLKFGMSSHDSLTGATSVVHFFTDAMIMFGGGGVPIIGLLSASADRPLGLHENGRDQTALPNHVIVLTREIIEAALARPALGPIPSPVANGFPGQGLMSTPPIARVGMISPKPGVMMLQFEDRNVSGMLAFPERPAIYQMFIQVERIP